MRIIETFLRLTDAGAIEVTKDNKPKGVKSFIIRNQPVTLAVGIFKDDKTTEIMTKAELEAWGCMEWRLDISKNHSLMYPVYLQPDYLGEGEEGEDPVTVSAEGIISIVLAHTDTVESSAAIKGMQFDMWEAELTGLPAKETDTAETEVETDTDTESETTGEPDDSLIDDAAEDADDKRRPIVVLQWQIGYTNRIAAEDADPPSIIEKYYYTITQTNAIIAALRKDISDNYVDNDELASVREELDEAIGQRETIIKKTVVSNENILSPEPGKTYRWTIADNGEGTITFDASHLPNDGDGAAIDIYISLGKGGTVKAEGEGVEIADEVLSSGWYSLTAVNADGTVTASLYAKMGQTVLDGGRI